MKRNEKKPYEGIDVAILKLDGEDVIATSKPFYGEEDPVKSGVNENSYAI